MSAVTSATSPASLPPPAGTCPCQATAFNQAQANAASSAPPPSAPAAGSTAAPAANAAAAKAEAKLQKMAAHVGKDAAHVLKRLGADSSDLSGTRVAKTLTKFLAFLGKVPADMAQNVGLGQLGDAAKATLGAVGGKGRLGAADRSDLRTLMQQIAQVLGASMPPTSTAGSTDSGAPGTDTTSPAAKPGPTPSDTAGTAPTDGSSTGPAPADGAAAAPSPVDGPTSNAPPAGGATAGATDTPASNGENVPMAAMIADMVKALSGSQPADMPKRDEVTQLLAAMQQILPRYGLDKLNNFSVLMSRYLPRALELLKEGTEPLIPFGQATEYAKFVLEQISGALEGKPIADNDPENCGCGQKNPTATDAGATAGTTPAADPSATAGATPAADPSATGASGSTGPATETADATDTGKGQTEVESNREYIELYVPESLTVMAAANKANWPAASAVKEFLTVLVDVVKNASLAPADAKTLSETILPKAVSAVGNAATPFGEGVAGWDVFKSAMTQVMNAYQGKPLQAAA